MRIAALSEVADIDRIGVDPTGLDPKTPYLGLEHIARGGAIVGRSTVGEAELASTKYAFTDEHVLFGKLRPYLGKVARPTFSGVCSTDILPIRPGKNLDRGYLLHYLRQPSMVELAESRAAGANLPRLSPGQLAAFKVPLPPLHEQRRIAAILDQADELRAKRRQSLALLDDLSQAVFAELSASADDVYTLRELGVDFVSGKNVVGHGSGAHPNNRIIKVSAISSGVFLPLESKPMPSDYRPPCTHLIRPGDILFGRASGSLDLLGAIAVVNTETKNLYLPDKVWRLQLAPDSGVTAGYVLHALRARRAREFIRHNASGAAGVRNIAKSKLLAYSLPVPELHLQQELDAVLESIEAQRAAAQRSLDGLDELFASLQARAFSGQL